MRIDNVIDVYCALFSNGSGDVVFWLFQDEAETEAQWRDYSDVDFTYWSCDNYADKSTCEPNDHGRNARPQDCIAPYNSRDYNMSDWECDTDIQTSPWVVNNVLCRNPEYHPDLACNCECAKCNIEGDPHVHTFDDTYFHPMVLYMLYVANTLNTQISLL